MPSRTSTFVIAFGLGVCVALDSGSAAAQPRQPATETPAAPTPQAARERRWQIGAHVGPSIDQQPTTGTASLPSTGTTVGGLVSASTFYFGTGASLFNQYRSSLPIAALDQALSILPVHRNQGFSVGVRAQRALSARLAVELSGDYIRSQVRFTPDVRAALDAASSSYQSALAQTLALSPEASSASSATTVIDDQLATRLVVTGALIVRLRTSGSTIPYILGGAGMMRDDGNALSATLDGHYVLGATSYLEARDIVWMRYQEPSRSVVVLVGSGITRDVSPRVGLRADLRFHVLKNAGVTLVDVAPSRVQQSQGSPFPVLAIGGLRFDATGPLSGAPLTAAATFTGSGLRMHTAATVGLFVRF